MLLREDRLDSVGNNELPALEHLLERKGQQIERFLALRPRFQEIVASMGKPPEWFVVCEWQRLLGKLAERWTPYPPVGFLRAPEILEAVHVNGNAEWATAQAKLLQARLPDRVLATVLPEDPLGFPVIRESKTLASHQHLHTLCHIVRWLAHTGELRLPGTVVEWGGGYGTFAKLYRRLAIAGGDSREHTHILIDVPLMAGLQWLYLSAVFGSDEVCIPVEGRRGLLKIVPGKFNIVPAHLCGLIGPRADMFVSTWALSESPDKVQCLVQKLRFFGAPHLLMAHQKPSKRYPDAARILAKLPRPFDREPCGYISDNWYVFK